MRASTTIAVSRVLDHCEPRRFFRSQFVAGSISSFSGSIARIALRANAVASTAPADHRQDGPSEPQWAVAMTAGCDSPPLPSRIDRSGVLSLKTPFSRFRTSTVAFSRSP